MIIIRQNPNDIKGGEFMECFGANKIVKQQIIENNFHSYFVNFDLNDNGESYYRIDEFVKLLMNVIPEFSFGHHLGTTTDNTQLLSVLSQATKNI